MLIRLSRLLSVPMHVATLRTYASSVQALTVWLFSNVHTLTNMMTFSFSAAMVTTRRTTAGRGGLPESRKNVIAAARGGPTVCWVKNRLNLCGALRPFIIDRSQRPELKRRESEVWTHQEQSAVPHRSRG